MLWPALVGDPRIPVLDARTLYDRFVETAATDPGKLAIYDGDTSTTYAEAARIVADLAGRLKLLGIHAHDRIIIQIPRSPQFVLSVYATLAVGGVFVPLSENEPDRRVRHIYQNVNASAVMRLDHARRDVVAERLPFGGTPLDVEGASEAAYILHTSGSTGVPKGVAISWGALSNCLSWHVERFSINADSVIAQINLTSFDLSISEVLLPMAVGATAAIPASSVASDMIGVINTLGEAGTTFIQMVPTILTRFLRAVALMPVRVTTLMDFRTGGHMVCNGEPLSDAVRRNFYREFPDCTLHNCYGPTEACIAVTEYRCTKGDEARVMYIGAAVPNVSIYICDQSQNSVATGVPGELLIGGAQIGLGYVGDPVETSVRFMRVNTTTGAEVVYRTGDLVRQGGSGLLEFISRMDSQVKYKSVRIELGEIEAVAMRSGLCAEAGAVVVHGTDGGPRDALVLFVSPLGVPTLQLVQFLARELPRDRQPTSIVALSALPATERGKLDRGRLAIVASESVITEFSEAEERRDAPLTAQDPLDILLGAVKGVTNRRCNKDDPWPPSWLDSLGLLDVELALLEQGVTFNEEPPSESTFAQAALLLKRSGL
jgi:amino acid adenylation domain-containing protein